VSLCAEAPRRDWRLFFFGGAPGRAEEAALILRERFPGLRVVGAHCPPLGFERDEKLWAAGVASLKQAHEGTEGPLDLIFLALGAPKSEKTAARLIAEGGPPAVYVNVGAAFDFVCGKPKRAPAWMRRVGLEWFWRLARDPRRLFRRYILRDLPLFLALMARPDRSKTKQP
jgi:N-acetylglucosaminyldiphosphoundecaprenol N-acetyl-beta-D-mannosaminyltransferase